MYGSPPIKSLEKHKWNIRIVRAKINSEKIELETSYEKSNEIFLQQFGKVGVSYSDIVENSID